MTPASRLVVERSPPDPAAGGAGRQNRLRLLFFAKLAVSVGLLAWLLSHASLDRIVGALGAASGPLVLSAILLNFAGCLVSTWRWRSLLRVQAIRISPWFLLRSYLVGLFLNNFLPTTVGGDASRAYDCYRATKGNRYAVSTVVVDRLLGLLALVLLALAGGLLLTSPLHEQLPELPLWLAVAAALLLLLVGSIFVQPVARPGFRFPSLPGLPGRLAAQGLAAAALYRGQWSILARAFTLSLVLQITIVLRVIILAYALHLTLPVLNFVLIVPLILFATMLPISINGIGIREAALVGLLAGYGIAPTDAVALAWLDYGVGLSAGLAGGLILALRQNGGPGAAWRQSLRP